MTLKELPALADVPGRVSNNDNALAEIVGLCGSFLTLRGRTIFFVHQSAKDFLFNQAHIKVFSSKVEDIDHTIFSRSLRVMQKTLRRDIYNIGVSGFSIDKVTPPNPDLLAAVRYSCIYWVSHLRDCHLNKDENDDLQAGGSVEAFLRESYLYWLEALSLLKSIPEGVSSMLELEKLLKVSFWPSNTGLTANVQPGRDKNIAFH